MAPDFNTYLATQIVAEKQTVSYRNVSRALKVHVNSAKCMLYEFWEKENRKRAGSVHATFLIAGVRRRSPEPTLTNGKTNHVDEDEPMQSSPPTFTSSMPAPSQQSHHSEEGEDIPVKTITLVREEDLDACKAGYDSITSIHMYSLSPGRLQDLVVLTDIGRAIYADSSTKEDPLLANKLYGVIQNPDVRRRKGKRPVVSDGTTSKLKAVKEDKPPKQDASRTGPAPAGNQVEGKDASRPSSRESSVSLGSNKQPSLKRDGSNLFKAFAKAQNKPKLGRKDTDVSTNASASGTEEAKAADADEEGESEDDALFLDTGTKKNGSRKRSSDIKKDREDKRAKLRKMMDSDGEEEKAVPKVEEAAGLVKEPASVSTKEDDQIVKSEKDKDEVAWSDSDTESQKKDKSKQTEGEREEEKDEKIPAEPKRRRGKRKVMKKRTTKDEDGYLVTKEEAVWESFSEDDDDDDPKGKAKGSKTIFSASSSKSQPRSSNAAGAGAGAGAVGGAKGGSQQQQSKKKAGDIMSFFGKR